MSYPKIIERLQKGEEVTLSPKGQSMTPRIKSGQKITISPVKSFRKGDVVLALVNGRHYIHLITAINEEKRRVQISNNHGHVNGWTSFDKIYGIVKDV